MSATLVRVYIDVPSPYPLLLMIKIHPVQFNQCPLYDNNNNNIISAGV